MPQPLSRLFPPPSGCPVLTALVSHGDHFVPVERTGLPELIATRGALFWVDLEAPTADEIAVLAHVFHFHQLTIDDCLNRRLDPPKVDDCGEYLFVIVQGIDFTARQEAVVTTELNLYVGATYVVSFHHRPLPAVSETRERCPRAAPVPARGPDWLTHACSTRSSTSSSPWSRRWGTCCATWATAW